MNSPNSLVNVKPLAIELLTWFDVHGRKHLPWQIGSDPYRIWISEIMLQQTQVATVIPYYLKFIHAFPDINKLSRAPLDDVLSLWAGLGYYARARNLHATAKMVSLKFEGLFPSSYDDIIALPGIGRSTAGAILSMAFNKPYAILDGNVKRVLARYYAIAGWPGELSVSNTLWEHSNKLTPQYRVADYTQAIMDLGATVCTAKPHCDKCPFQDHCLAHQTKTVHLYPGKKPKKIKPIETVQLVIARHNDDVLLYRRPDTGIWGGLWSLPELALKDDVAQWIRDSFKTALIDCEYMPAFRHTFTHYHLNIHPVLVNLKRKSRLSSPFQWHSLDQLSLIGLPAPVKTLLLSIRDKELHVETHILS